MHSHLKTQTKNLSVLAVVTALSSCTPLTNRLAFHPDTVDVTPTHQLPNKFQEKTIPSTNNNQLQSYFIPQPTSKRLIIYFHGNAGNLSHRISDLEKLHDMGLNVLAISYRGYGSSSGKASEKGIYDDGKATLNYALTKLNFKEENIFIMGRSIGTTVAINTAQHKNISGLILTSPLTKGSDQAKQMGLGAISFIAGKAFNNIGKTKNISCPTLVIHGTEDDVIPLHMGQSIYDSLNTKKQFIKIIGADHNNLSDTYASKYWPPIQEFITQ